MKRRARKRAQQREVQNADTPRPVPASGFAVRAVCNVLVFTLSLTAASWALGRIAPNRGDWLIQAKLRHFAEHRDEIQVLFLGTSRTIRQIVPQVFDEQLRAGWPGVKSFNLGVPGARGYEVNALLAEVLRLDPAQLRYVVLDPHDFDPEIKARNRLTQREVWWHNWTETYWICVAAWEQPQPLRQRLEAVGMHLQHLLVRYTRIGEGPQMVRTLLGLEPPDPLLDQLLANEGFESLDDRLTVAPDGLRARHQGLLANRRRFAKMRQQLARHDEKPVELAPWNVRGVQRQVATIRAAGLKPVFVLSPLLRDPAHAQTLAKKGHIPVLLAFNDPRRYPKLYEIGNRFDFTHLNARGARLFSRLVAEEFAARLGSPPPD